MSEQRIKLSWAPNYKQDIETTDWLAACQKLINDKIEFDLFDKAFVTMLVYGGAIETTETNGKITFRHIPAEELTKEQDHNTN